MPSTMAHSHKSTTKVAHKPFKAAGKGRRHKGSFIWKTIF